MYKVTTFNRAIFLPFHLMAPRYSKTKKINFTHARPWPHTFTFTSNQGWKTKNNRVFCWCCVKFMTLYRVVTGASTIWAKLKRTIPVFCTSGTRITTKYQQLSRLRWTNIGWLWQCRYRPSQNSGANNPVWTLQAPEWNEELNPGKKKAKK